MKCVYELFARFREGREIVFDKPCSERPATSVSDENIEKINPDRPSINCTRDSWTMDAARCIEILARFIKRLHRVRTLVRTTRFTIFVPDNAHPRTAKQFLAKKGVDLIEHPPFLPDINPPDFFLFPQLKLTLKGKI
ncbi:hypothetical protein TNCV_3598441 [Trichonephila clavipes]|nr:hypothetical protein TNCV_3598441 [Trichonephila clavipes]